MSFIRFLMEDQNLSFIKKISPVVSTMLPVDEKITIRKCRYSPSDREPSGRICIATGIHGDELMGQLVVYNVAQKLSQYPNSLCGIVDIYPMLNPLGLDLTERMVPSRTQLDMNRAFPGSPNGTPLENICWHLLQDMKDSNLVLDIHASTHFKSELFEIRINAPFAQHLLPIAQQFNPDLIWIYPDSSAYGSSLSASLCDMGTDACIIEADERRRNPQEIANRITDSIFSYMSYAGLWTESQPRIETKDIPIIRDRTEISRVTCEHAGIFIPENLLGQTIEKDVLLGKVINALTGETLEYVTSPCQGLVFSQRSYSSVYPGTLLARIHCTPLQTISTDS